ncbi:hypothetical protein PENTCL1PPCAC_26040, partial [Pristionchus entomophagus]
DSAVFDGLPSLGQLQISSIGLDCKDSARIRVIFRESLTHHFGGVLGDLIKSYELRPGWVETYSAPMKLLSTENEMTNAHRSIFFLILLVLIVFGYYMNFSIIAISLIMLCTIVWAIVDLSKTRK